MSCFLRVFLSCRLVCVVGLLLFCVCSSFSCSRHCLLRRFACFRGRGFTLLFCLCRRRLLCSFSCSRHCLLRRFACFHGRGFTGMSYFVVSFCLVGLLLFCLSHRRLNPLLIFLPLLSLVTSAFLVFPCWVGRSVLEGSDDRRKVADAMVGIMEKMPTWFLPTAQGQATAGQEADDDDIKSSSTIEVLLTCMSRLRHDLRETSQDTLHEDAEIKKACIDAIQAQILMVAKTIKEIARHRK